MFVLSLPLASVRSRTTESQAHADLHPSNFASILSRHRRDTSSY